MAWTSLPLKAQTRERIEALDAKDGRDWDTFLRRELLSESVDGDRAWERTTQSFQLMEVSDPLPEIQEAVDETNGMTLYDHHADEEFEVGDWLSYHIRPRDDSFTAEDHYDHLVSFADVPIEFDGHALDSRLMVWLQKELNLRDYFILGVDFSTEDYIIQHNDLIYRRVERGPN